MIIPKNSTSHLERGLNCWLGGALPDLNQDNSTVKQVQKAHLQKLLDLGIDGFRFDAAKHMSPEAVQEYISYINQASNKLEKVCPLFFQKKQLILLE